LGGGLFGLALLAFAVGGFDGAAARFHLFGRQTAGAALLTRLAGGRRRGVGARTRDVEALRALMPGARADPALGLDDHGLGPPMAEALAHGAGRNRSRLPWLE